MGKRRTYEERWDQQWFRELKGTSKLFYDYIFDKVDWAGFIAYDMSKFSFETGLEEHHITGAIQGLISPSSAPYKGLMHLKEKNLLWLPDYCELQSNFPLNESNNAHAAIIRTLKSHMDVEEVDNYVKSRGLLGAEQPPSNVVYSNHTDSNNKDGEENHDPFEDTLKQEFAKGLKRYPGTKRSLKVEWGYFKKIHKKDYKEFAPLIPPAIEYQIDAKSKQTDDDRDPWAHFKTWIYNSYWTLEIQVKSVKKVVAVG